jgi:uncharacterized lipoprotein YmbA
MTQVGDQPRHASVSRVLALVLSAMALAACSHGLPTRFYTLDPIAPSKLSTGTAGGRIRVLAVRMPAAMDRLEVTRETAPGALTVNDMDRWGAPLGDLATAALAQDLAERFPRSQILSGRSPAKAPARTISVDVFSFLQKGETSVLNVDVQIADATTGTVLDIETFHLSTLSQGRGSASEALALSDLLAALADQLCPLLEGSSDQAAGRAPPDASTRDRSGPGGLPSAGSE